MRSNVFCGFALWIALAGVSAAVERRPSPRFEGESIPAPPEQESPWAPPETELPEVFVTATAKLFAQGLADPRGCEYREIEVGTGSCWSGDAGVVRIHGWVLPVKRRVGQRFAVCWNGLVYPVVTLGAEADCRADVEALLKEDRAFVEKQLARHEEREARRREKATAAGREHHSFPPHIRYNHAIAEPGGVSHESMLPLKAALVLRLGHADLAERIWSQWHAGWEKKVQEDPYVSLARDWTWSLFDRAVCAHMRRDDRLALLSARPLAQVRGAVEAEAGLRGPERNRHHLTGQDRFHLDFLGQLPDVLADQERRNSEPKRVRRTSPDKLPKFERIAARIEMLDEVAERQWGQPGSVSIGAAAVVKALVKEGDDAVGPLLKCLEEDTRLTRSVQLGRSFHRGRTIIGVYETAYAALGGILRSGRFGEGTSHYDLTTGGMAGRRVIAAKIRAYWEKHRDVSVWERRYRILADDDATPKQWLEAARGIVHPVDVKVTFGDAWVTVPHRKPGEVPKLSGEPLRDRRRPTVAELMAKRVDILSNHGPPGSRREFAMHKACDIALCLAKWDIVAAFPTLRWQVRRCRERMAGHVEDVPSTIEAYALYIADLTLERARGGDKSALKEYAEWIRTILPKSIGSYTLNALKPIWRHPDHPATAEAAEWLFNDEESPWWPLLRSREEGGSHRLWGLLNTPL
ncbi:MAG: hypothetical protein ACYS9X_28700, partial [Planctomycetota bacterium]